MLVESTLQWQTGKYFACMWIKVNAILARIKPTSAAVVCWHNQSWDFPISLVGVALRWQSAFRGCVKYNSPAQKLDEFSFLHLDFNNLDVG